MAEIKWIEYNGKKILLMDFSYSEKQEVVEAVKKTMSITEKEQPGSVLGLVDVSKSSFDNDVAASMKELAKHNKPYIKMSVIVGVDGIKKVIYNAALVFSGRKNLVLKSTREEALEFLAKQ